MKILLTGSNGFIAQNLALFLAEVPALEVVSFSRGDSLDEVLQEPIDFVFHLAGVNRPQHDDEFQAGNVELTKSLVESLVERGFAPSVLFASSTQADQDNAYGRSKALAEDILRNFGKKVGAKVFIYRLSNVFGKWARPNYNSVIATFIDKLLKNQPIDIHDPGTKLRLSYIDDVCAEFVRRLTPDSSLSGYYEIENFYETTVGELAEKLTLIKKSRTSTAIPNVGSGLMRPLYATYLSYLPKEDFRYPLRVNSDSRGKFVEILQTSHSGQFSFFTADPGITRGGHYHHTKNEKFIVLRGKAKFRFYNLLTGETYEIVTDDQFIEAVETCPGWSHDITNVGNDELIVALWANEIFDPEAPDTIAKPFRD